MVLMARVAATMAMTFETLDSLPRGAEDGDVLMVVVDENRSENEADRPVSAKKTSCQGPSFDKPLTSFQRAAGSC